MKSVMLLLALSMAHVSAAEEFGAQVTVTGETPVAVSFLKCSRNEREVQTETTPAVCKERHAKDTFPVKTARVTNLRNTVLWVHVGEDKVPVLPKTVFNAWSIGEAGFRRVFLSASSGETARVHVFASDPIQHDRFPALAVK